MELFKLYRVTKDASIRIPYKTYIVKGNKRPNAACLMWTGNYWTVTAIDVEWLHLVKPDQKLSSPASQELIKYLFAI